MSDDVLILIPADEEYVPSAKAQKKAIALLQRMLPEGEDCEAEVYDELQFIYSGENCEAVFCPSCERWSDLLRPPGKKRRGPVERWWDEVNDAVADLQEKSGSVREVRTSMPCCGASVPFTSLEFYWPCGFAHFELSIWNPNVGHNLAVKQLSKLEDVLGCKLRQIRMHM